MLAEAEASISGDGMFSIVSVKYFPLGTPFVFSETETVKVSPPVPGVVCISKLGKSPTNNKKKHSLTAMIYFK